MPRGVKGSGKKPAAAKKPLVSTVIAPPAPPAAKAEPEKVNSWQPVASVCVDDLQGEALRAHAARVGVSKRDIEHLTDDRLRQNIKFVIADHFELLTEG